MANSSRGRPTGGSDARDRIIAAARRRFSEDGYRATSVRAIARDAGVHHSLVKYHFGGKDGLFGAVLDLVLTPGRMAGPVLAEASLETLPRRILIAFTAAWEDPVAGPPLCDMVRSAATHPDAEATLRGYIDEQLISGVIARLGGPDARLRAGTMATVLWGLVVGRYVWCLSPVAEMTRQQVIDHFTPLLAAALAGPRARPPGGLRAAAYPPSWPRRERG